jgi:hypothetical protein
MKFHLENECEFPDGQYIYISRNELNHMTTKEFIKHIKREWKLRNDYYTGKI